MNLSSFNSKCFVTLCFLILILFGHALFVIETNAEENVVPKEAWSAVHDGTASDWDMAFDIAVDGSGNAYVTGYSEYLDTDIDFATIKYNSSGVLQWISRYNGPVNGEDKAFALAMDASNNIYVTGYSEGDGTGLDYTTIKYNASGVQQWVARYNYSNGFDDEACDIAVDGSGNVHVTGKSLGSFATIKYNSSGAEQWVARYDCGYHDGGEAVAVDGSGNVYVTGRAYNNAKGDYDYATIKYNAGGVEQWVVRYDGPVSDDDRAFAIALDGSGNVYITGESEGGGSDKDFATVKYNSSGVQQWVARYDGAMHDDDRANDLVVDASGNVYITGGATCNDSPSDYITIKYNSSGVQEWIARYDGAGYSDDEPKAIALDGAGNVYVAGQGNCWGTGATYNSLAIKYDMNGNQLWLACYSETHDSSDEACAMAIDGGGNVYLTGRTVDPISAFDYLTIKYGQAVGCLIENVFYEPGETNPENVCEICNPAQSESEWSNNDGASCDDVLFCNGTDTCASGTCSLHAGDPCDENEQCNEDTDTCDPLDDDDDAIDDDTVDDDEASDDDAEAGGGEDDDDDAGGCGC